MFEKYAVEKMPTYMFLARMGKRVLRPGGTRMTENILTDLDISPSDTVVELAPGRGATAKLILGIHPRQYVGIEQNEEIYEALRRDSFLKENHALIEKGSATHIPLLNQSSDKVLGEAMLTMQPANIKEQIITEVHRILKLNGEYAIHEIALQDATKSNTDRSDMELDMLDKFHVNARPLTMPEWKALFDKSGFEVKYLRMASLSFLHISNLFKDEGILGFLRILFRVLTTPGALKRVKNTRRDFNHYANHLTAFSMVLVKKR